MPWVEDTQKSIPAAGGSWVEDTNTTTPALSAYENIQQQTLADKVQKYRDAIATERGYNRRGDTNAEISLAKRVTDAALATPSFLANLTTAPFTNVAKFAGMGGPSVPTPTSEGLTAAGYAGLQGLRGQDAQGNPVPPGQTIPSMMQTYNSARENLDLAEHARETVHPYSTAAGNVGGDLFTLLGPRLLAAPAIVGATRSPGQAFKATWDAAMGPDSPWTQAKTIWEMPAMQSVRRGLGKMAETGFEASTLSTLHGGDPVTAGLMAATSQGVGSALMTMGRLGWKYPMSGLGIIGAGTLAYQMWKDATPGGRDSLLQSAQGVIKGYTWAMILGAIGATLTGAGRFRGSGLAPETRQAAGWGPQRFADKFARNIPESAEGINTLMRGGQLSLFSQLSEDQKSTRPIIGPVMEKLSSSMNQFQPAEIDKLSKAIAAGKLRPTVLQMLNDKTTNADGQTFAQRMGF